MATQAGFVRDQNLNVHFKGAPSALKTNKPQKNGGLGGRKALGDISNSRRPTTIQPPNKIDLKYVIPVAEDTVPAISKSSLGAKVKASTKGAGRKALGDLTNSAKPPAIRMPKKTFDKNLNAVVEEPFPFDSEAINEHFLHDHGACIRAQEKAKAMDMMYFLKEYGIDTSVQSSPPWNPPVSAKMKAESPTKFDEMEELFKLQHEDTSQFDKYEAFGEALCASPVSPPCFQWDDDMILSYKAFGEALCASPVSPPCFQWDEDMILSIKPSP